MQVAPTDKTIDELVADLDKARDRFYDSPNDRTRLVREKQAWKAIARLNEKLMQAEFWMHENFDNGRDEIWLDVLAKYQRGAKSLQQGLRKTLPDHLLLHEPPTLRTKSEALTAARASLLNA